MKFSHTFEAALRKEEYPPEWVSSAVSYRQLKKCIKIVQNELQGLGLGPATLQRLWQHVDGTAQVSLEGADQGSQSPSSVLSEFRPKLTIAVDPQDGSPVDAWLSPQTRRYLHDLACRQQVERRQSNKTLDELFTGESLKEDVYNKPENNVDKLETVELPLTSYGGFFPILGRQVQDLDQLHKSEQRKLRNQIVQLGHGLNALSGTSPGKSRKEVYAWREIFRLYIESQIFFSTNEQDAGSRDADQASTQLELFTKALQQKKSLKLGKDGQKALVVFMGLNVELLKFLKYQEINRMAMSKIIKKIMKKTALGAWPWPTSMLAGSRFVAQNLAKATCFTISTELLTIIPQLEDYLCPVCFSISFKPVRLRCNHVFCIRCLVVMQRARQDHCPLCRSEVVMEASKCRAPMVVAWIEIANLGVVNLDVSLLRFLEDKFPKEVRVKQRENEIAAGVDHYGEGYEKCCVM